MPHACPRLRGICIIPLISFNFWLALKLSGSWNQSINQPIALFQQEPFYYILVILVMTFILEKVF